MTHKTESHETEHSEQKNSEHGASTEIRLLKAKGVGETRPDNRKNETALRTARPLEEATLDNPDHNAPDAVSGRIESDKPPHHGDRFEQLRRSLGTDLADISTGIDRSLMTEALTDFDPIAINDILVQFDSAVDADLVSRATAIKEASALLHDMVEARGVSGLSDSTTSVVELLRDTDVFSAEWHGYRFEVQYAALHAGEIKEVNCSNYVDVQMRDGSYRELKSFSHYDGKALRNVIDQLKKDIDPNNRGASRIRIVFDTTYDRPSDSFLRRFEAKAEELKETYNRNAEVTWEIV